MRAEIWEDIAHHQLAVITPLFSPPRAQRSPPGRPWKRGRPSFFSHLAGQAPLGGRGTGTGCVEVTQVMAQQGGEGVGDMDMAPVVMAAGPRHRRRIVKLEESVVNKIAAG